jgi:acyl-CoA synthetase (NDP forming)
MTRIAIDQIRDIVGAAREAGRSVLLETEGIALLNALGLNVPAHVFIRGSGQLANVELDAFDGASVVVKVISADIIHKSDVGGVAVVANNRNAVGAVIADMEERFHLEHVEGYTVHQFIPYKHALGHELLLGLRWTADFGPVIAFGPGGIYSEFLSENLKDDRDVAILSTAAPPRTGVEDTLRQSAVTAVLNGNLRGQEPLIAMERIVDVVDRIMALASEFAPDHIREFEINPLVVSGGDLHALDVVVKLGNGVKPALPERPIQKIKNLLEPRSVAIIGVSKAMNPGHVILNNLIRDGFDKQKTYIVKPGLETIEECRCYPDIASLPERVELFVLSSDASQMAGAVAEIIEQKKAESSIIIPGGLEEKAGTEEIVARMRGALLESRSSDWGGPVINGGNSLGIRSLPGRYDTMFIPGHKIGQEPEGPPNVAFISQSGAFAVSKNSKLSRVNQKYTISLGNQTDLTVGDYLTYLKNDPDLEIFAVYLEGFKPLDGIAFLRAAREITESGKSVILYRSGRTPVGAKASASHTASVAGDFVVTRQLCKGAGVVVADSIADFEDHVMLFALLRDKSVMGRRLGALSNAGFECVTIADNLGEFQMEPFGPDTTRTIADVLEESRLDTIVDIHNPLDLTPMMGDEGYEAAARAILADDGVDVGIISCVPLTPALNTLAPGDGHSENVFAEDGITRRIARVITEQPKACIAVIDAGPLYDAMARLLEKSGIPTFRTADRALRLFNIYCEMRLRR